MKNNIDIYTLPGCGYCATVKDFLKENNIDFNEKVTSEFADEWNEITFTTGMSTTPTIIYKDLILVPGRDYVSPEHLKGILDNYTVPNVDKKTLIIERLKTLSYGLNISIKRLEEKLNED